MQKTNAWKIILLIFAVLLINSPFTLSADDNENIFSYKKSYEYRYKVRNSVIGSEKFTFDEAEEENKKCISLTSEFNVGNDKDFQKGNSKFLFTLDFKPLSYSRDLQVNLPARPQRNGKYKMQYQFTEKEVKGSITQDEKVLWQGSVEGQIDFFIDNNALSLFAVLCQNTMKGSPNEKTVKAFHPLTLRIMDVKFVKSGKEEVMVNQKSYITTRYQVSIDTRGIGFFCIMDNGKLIKDEEPAQGLVVELVE